MIERTSKGKLKEEGTRGKLSLVCQCSNIYHTHEFVSMEHKWKVDVLDALLVPLGLLMLIIYHIRLAYKIWKTPSSTILGLNHLALQAWVHATLKDGLQNGVFVVQTMRNSIMSSSSLAAAAVAMTTMLGFVVANNMRSLASGISHPVMLGEGGLLIGFPIKLAAVVPFFFIATLCYMHSATCYSNGSLLLGMLSQSDTSLPLLAHEHFKKSLVWASMLRFIGTRAFFFTFPIFSWLYGPIAMVCTSFILTTLLHFQDSTHNVKPAHLKTSESMRALYADQGTHETSLLIDSDPFPPDSVCLFCPHH